MSLEVVAIISPAPGKTDRILELLKGVSAVVAKQEPGTLRYEYSTQVMTKDPPKIVFLEKYKDAEALKAHGKFPEFAEMNKIFKEEKLTAGRMQVYIVTPVGGVKSRL